MHTQTKLYLRYFICTLLVLFFSYFLLSTLFIFQAAYTDYSCPGQLNTPTHWQLPSKIATHAIPDSDAKYNALHIEDWQLPHYQSVHFPSRMAKVDIHAWYTAVNPKAPVVIVVHGIHPNCKNDFESLLISAMLAQGGLNVLNIDLQNYGLSTRNSRFIAFGQREYLDILGSYDWLRQQGYAADQIGVAGLSLGGVTSAIAFSQETDIRAVWLDSPFADFDTMFCYELNRRNFPCFFRYGVEWIGKIILGISPNTIPPTAAITDDPQRFMFLTHGKNDTRIPFFHAETFLTAAKAKHAQIDYWFVDDSAHLEAMLLYPRLYQQKMLHFFKSHLANRA